MGGHYRYEYDRDADVLTIVLSEDDPDHGELAENIITHYAEDGKPIEILDASEAALDFIRPMLARGSTVAEA